MKRIVGFLLCAVLLLFLCGCNSQDYKKATSLYQDGDFSSAKVIFDELGDYEDAATMSKDCSYNMAIELLNDGAYSEAYALFAELGDYKDSAEYAAQAKWEELYFYIGNNSEYNSILGLNALFFDIASEEEKADDISSVVAFSVEDEGTIIVAIANWFDTGKISFVKTMRIQLIRGNTEAEWHYFWVLAKTGYTNASGYIGVGTVNVDTCTADTSLEFDTFYSVGSDGTTINDEPTSIDMNVMTGLWAELINTLPDVLMEMDLPITMKDLGFLAVK